MKFFEKLGKKLDTLTNSGVKKAQSLKPAAVGILDKAHHGCEAGIAKACLATSGVLALAAVKVATHHTPKPEKRTRKSPEPSQAAQNA